MVLGDLAIVAVAIAGLFLLKEETGDAQYAAVLTSAFATISTMTTAYFGIRAATNTAQTSITGNKSEL
ncbi:hypothetical protein [Micromonospora citrea]|uniref:hypothetical protein n=1 Tax=Micromonospora citrea TaxID=47855 RepID=UPI00114CC379|nr:hypothetical protein [Micromonospora citrea]